MPFWAFQIIPLIIKLENMRLVSLDYPLEDISPIYKCTQNALDSISSEFEVKFDEVRKNNK